MWPYHGSQRTAGCRLSILFLILQSIAFLSQPAHANVFGVLVARLRYDIVSVSGNQTDIHNLNVVISGSDLPLGIISKTAGIPREGLSGLLYDMGYGCHPGVDNITISTPNSFNLPKIALIRRGGPTDETACSFRLKLLVAQAEGAAAAIIYNGPDSGTIESATASNSTSEEPLKISGMFISYDGGVLLRSFLQQQSNNTAADPNFNNRVRINVAADRRMPVVWEFILIVVVILLGLSFTVSVVLHCRLYALRQRYRAEALARGGDILPNGTIRMRKTLDKCDLDQFPVRVFSQVNSSAGSTSATAASTSGCKESKGVSETSSQSKSSDAKPNPLSRLKSNRSVRSVSALASAEALDVGAGTTEAVNDTCAICIEEFVEGDEVRILPCHHDFHSECIDPWLTRKSATCPLCKYECKKALQETEDHSDRASTDTRVLPNDRLMEFIMGPEWVAARTQHHHNGTSWVDRIGNFFGNFFFRMTSCIPGRRARPTPVDLSLSQTTTAEVVQVDNSGEVPLQLITPHGVAPMTPDASVSVTIHPPVQDSSSRTQTDVQNRV
ncbi:hypothetical protein B0O80DRAFT_435808 [Mortierella sp. GBAus27b]|nr:hypothetical protein BGX31_000147 [Mortierella sp. GBA43]KAI8362401.1 hypothetical protein B0O80DRAFT_435808 [Mortierella sp. GBAus27b]